MNLDFDYYGGKDLREPSLPKLRRIDATANSAQVRDYAERLEKYEAQLEAFKSDHENYTQQKNSRLYELKNFLRDEYDITEAQANLLWSKSWGDAQDEGLPRVVELFDDYYELGSQFAALEKN